MGKPNWVFRPDAWLEKLVTDKMAADAIERTTAIHKVVQDLIKQVEDAKTATPDVTEQLKALEKRVKDAEADRNAWRSYAEGIEKKTGIHIDRAKPSQPAAPQSIPPSTSTDALDANITQATPAPAPQASAEPTPHEVITPIEKPQCRIFSGSIVSIEWCVRAQTEHPEQCKAAKCLIYLKGDSRATKIEGLGVHPITPPTYIPKPTPTQPDPEEGTEDESERIIEEALEPDDDPNDTQPYTGRDPKP